MINVVVYSKETGYALIASSTLSLHIRDDKYDLLWIDLEAPTSEENAFLTRYFDFHPLAVEDCLTGTHLPKVDDYGDYIFLALQGSRSVTDSRMCKNTLNVFLGPRYLVTYRAFSSRSILETRERCLKNLPGILRGADVLLHDIIDRMVDHYFPVLKQYEEAMEGIEVEVFAHPRKETLNKIVVLKKEVMQLRRIILPQQDVLNRLSRDNFAVIGQKTLAYYRDIYDQFSRIADLADSYRDQLSGLLEAYLSVVSNRLNEVMKVLTMFTATLMPLTLITGIYGMNFSNMPELQTRYGYFGVLGIMGIIAMGLVIYFRTKKWL